MTLWSAIALAVFSGLWPGVVPRIVTVLTPVVAVPVAVRVSTVLLAVTGLAGFKLAVTPLGRPSTARVTAPVKLVRAMEMVVFPVAPWMTETAPGLPSGYTTRPALPSPSA